MQFCVILLVKMVCVSRMIRAAAQRDTLVTYVMRLLQVNVWRISVRMEEPAPV